MVAKVNRNTFRQRVEDADNALEEYYQNLTGTDLESLNTIIKKQNKVFTEKELEDKTKNTINYFRLIKKQNENTNLVEKELEKEITPESLDKLRRKNNIERSMYWSKQIELAEQHKKEAIIFFKHFYGGYLRDKALDKKQKELENIK